ncbi:outer membrane protein [Thalassospira lucentensis]|uniref:outer membrane protein n=1 Tax=Thalassospira lucentensis TaxID=168935 RepID=UPI003AA981FD
MPSNSSASKPRKIVRKSVQVATLAALGLAGLHATATAEEWQLTPYLRADLGYSSTVDDDGDLLDTRPERDTLDMSPNDSARYQIGAGLSLNSYLRTDITVSYRNNLTEAGGYFDPDGAVDPANRLNGGAHKTSNWSTMLNLYVDPFRAAGYDTGKFSPYLQGGIGWARNKTDNLVFAAGTRVFGDTHNDLAWQIGAGLNYAITDQWKIDVSYRFIDMGEARGSKTFRRPNGTLREMKREARFDLQAHEVLLGLQYQF